MLLQLESKLLLAFLLSMLAVAGANAQEIPFRLISGNRILIRGTVFSGEEVSMLVDAGADCTVIDDRADKRSLSENDGRAITLGLHKIYPFERCSRFCTQSLSHIAV